MSLINDALKRARKNQSSGGSADGPALQPVESSGARRGGLVMPVLIVVVLAVAGFFLWKWYHGSAPKAAANRPKPGATNQAAATGTNKPARSNPVSYAASKIAATERVNGTLPSIKGNAPDTLSDTPAAGAPASAAPTPATSTPPPAAPEPTQPEQSLSLSSYKIQSIFYLPSKPCAVINGLTVYIGDKVDGARVADIGKDWVALITSDGQTNRVIIGSAK